jgi:hypothetical protein
MKQTVLFLSVILALGIAVNGCIYEVVNDGIGSNEPDPNDPDPNDPDPDPDPDPGVKQRTFKFVGNSAFTDKVETYAFVDMRPSTPMIMWPNTYDPSTPELDFGLFLKSYPSDTFLLPSNHSVKINSQGTLAGTGEFGNTVTVETAEEQGTAFFYYPYQASVNGTTLTHKINNVQDQSSPDSLMDSAVNPNMLMISGKTSPFPLENGEVSIMMKHVFPVLRFRVNFDPSSSLGQTDAINSIKVYIANKDNIEVPLSVPLAGDYTVDLATAPGEEGYMGPVFTNYQSEITANINNSASLSAAGVQPSVWLIANKTILGSDERLVSVVETKPLMAGPSEYKIVDTFAIQSLLPGSVYDFHIGADASNTFSDHVVTYFPADKAANCYIVSKVGIVQIPTKSITDRDLIGDTVVWLWANKIGGGNTFDINELIEEKSIVYHPGPDADNSYVHFRVGTNMGRYTEGNVIIALLREGKIVWTWHIWITDTPKDVLYGYDNVNDTGKYFIDRNIGALSDRMNHTGIDNYGFMYQWGRKEPLYGGDGLNNESTAFEIARDNTIINTSFSWNFPTSWRSTTPAGTITIESATENPMTFIANNNSGVANGGADWLSPSHSDLWRSASGAKTDYDPCPYGYRVPSKSYKDANTGDLFPLYEGNDVYKNDNDYSTYYFKPVNGKYWEFKYNGWQAGDTGVETAWPAAGYRVGRNGGKLLKSGTGADIGNCYYWTSTPVATSLAGSHRVYTAGQIQLYSDNDFADRADAYPIRCVKE